MTVQNAAFKDAVALAETLGGNLIDGEWRSGGAGEQLETFDPARGDRIGAIVASDGADVDLAVSAARRSFDAGVWTSLPAGERAKILWRAGELIDQDAERIAQLETLDVGMPLAKARGLVAFAAEMFRYAAGWTTKLYGDAIDIGLPTGMYHAFTRKEPVGVAALITPWNTPFVLAANKAASALAAGCSVVLKPAEDTPLSALVLGEILMRAGVPRGVFNIVTGRGEVVGAALAEHPDVDKIGFTGSTAVGKRIVQSALGNMKRVTLELGGKSPVVVFEDADIAAHAATIANGVFSNSGQICVAGSRVYVHHSRHDELVEALAHYARGLKVASGFEPGAQIGPLVSARQRDRVEAMIASGVADGSQAVTGGGRLEGAGYFIAPTVLTAPRAGARILREEIFGPVVNVIPFDGEDEAVAAANDSDYGLAAAIYTASMQRGHRMSRRLKAGTVWVNTQLVMSPMMPFGGFKQSGWGRENGLTGIEAYTETKTVITPA